VDGGYVSDESLMALYTRARESSGDLHKMYENEKGPGADVRVRGAHQFEEERLVESFV